MIYCPICNEEVPEGRGLTCSHDCYVIWQVDIWRRKRKGGASRKLTLRQRLQVAQGQSMGKYERTCDNCGTLFKASNKKQYICSPTCAIMQGQRNLNSLPVARRVPSMPKMPWDKE